MTESTTSRRKFLTTGAAAIAGGAAAAAFPSVSVAAKPVVLKVQAAWGGGIFLEFAQDYVDRVNKMSGGSLKIDLLGVGARGLDPHERARRRRHGRHARLPA